MEMEDENRFIIREASVDDAVDLARIISESLPRSITSRQVKRELRKEKEDPEPFSKTFVAELDGKIVGQLVLEYKDLHLGEGVYVKTAAITGVCTDPDYRKKGVATTLLRVGLEFAKDNGVACSGLFTAISGPAQRLYSKLGFLDIETFQVQSQLVDFRFMFLSRLKARSRRLKRLRPAMCSLKNWNKVVVLEILGQGVIAFKHCGTSFKPLESPKKKDVVVSTDAETLYELMDGASWKDAVRSGKLNIKQGIEDDVTRVMRILQWNWLE
jgi:ribosomal protein S18 acetylase RimI-like enzyme